MLIILHRAADARTMAPTIEGLAPKDFHYVSWGLATLTDVPEQPLLSLDQVPAVSSNLHAALLRVDW